MALTIPTFTSPNYQMRISVNTGYDGLSVGFTLDPTLVASFSDQDLLDRLDTLRLAIEAFAPDYSDTNTYADWYEFDSYNVVNVNDPA